MKALSTIKYTFTIIGFGMLVGAFFLFSSTNTFLDEAVSARGTVVDLIRSSGSSDSGPTYAPVVQFTTSSGQAIEFTSSVSSNPPSYSPGESVEVLYLPNQPHNAKMSSFFSLWGGATIVGSMGGIFFLIGVGFFIVPMLRSRKEEYLRMSGTPIETEFQSVEQNTAITVNGRHPYRIVTQWQNPSTSEIHLFHSTNLWWDPSNHIGIYPIKVFIEKNNPKKYCVDLSFLPKLAK
mgnify:CR=1 FL=1